MLTGESKETSAIGVSGEVFVFPTTQSSVLGLVHFFQETGNTQLDAASLQQQRAKHSEGAFYIYDTDLVI